MGYDYVRYVFLFLVMFEDYLLILIWFLVSIEIKKIIIVYNIFFLCKYSKLFLNFFLCLLINLYVIMGKIY